MLERMDCVAVPEEQHGQACNVDNHRYISAGIRDAVGAERTRATAVYNVVGTDVVTRCVM